MQFFHEGNIVEAINLGNSLLYHLPNRVSLRDIRVYSIGGSTISSYVVVHHLRVLEGIGLGIPAIGDKHTFRRGCAAHSFDKSRPKVWTGSGDEGLWIIVLLVKSCDECCRVWKERTHNDNIRMCLNDRISKGGIVFRCVGWIDVVIDCLDTAFFQQCPCYVNLWLCKWIILSHIRCCLGT